MSILVFPFQEKQLKIFTAAIFDIVFIKKYQEHGLVLSIFTLNNFDVKKHFSNYGEFLATLKSEIPAIKPVNVNFATLSTIADLREILTNIKTCINAYIGKQLHEYSVDIHLNTTVIPFVKFRSLANKFEIETSIKRGDKRELYIIPNNNAELVFAEDMLSYIEFLLNNPEIQKYFGKSKITQSSTYQNTQFTFQQPKTTVFVNAEQTQQNTSITQDNTSKPEKVIEIDYDKLANAIVIRLLPAIEAMFQRYCTATNVSKQVDPTTEQKQEQTQNQTQTQNQAQSENIPETLLQAIDAISVL